MLGRIGRYLRRKLRLFGPSEPTHVDQARLRALYEKSPTTFRLRMSSDSALPVLLSKSTVCELLSISPRCLEMMVRDGDFPPPVQLGRHVYWSQVAVNNWYSSVFLPQEQWSPSMQRAPQVSPRF